MNVICIVGRMTADPETKQVGDKELAEFTVAVNKYKKDEADFFSVKAWGKQAEFIRNYLGKGRMVSVNGRMESRKYEKDGRKVTVWEISADNVSGLDKPAQPGSKLGRPDPWFDAAPPPPLPGEMDIEDPFA